MTTIAVIPARFNSTRFPGKPLALINGLPMVLCVWRRALAIKDIDDLVVATDHVDIHRVIKRHGGVAVFTSPSHESGTDRVAEVASKLDDEAIVLNVQGDLPYVSVDVCNQLIASLVADPSIAVATPVKAEQPSSKGGYYDPNVVKCVFDLAGNALYFSRKAIPDIKDCITNTPVWHRHIGIYAYRNKALQQITSYAPTQLEQYERLEQLRMLEHGFKIRTVLVTEDCGPDINCPNDLRKITYE